MAKFGPIAASVEFHGYVALLDATNMCYLIDVLRIRGNPDQRPRGSAYPVRQESLKRRTRPLLDLAIFNPMRRG